MKDILNKLIYPKKLISNRYLSINFCNLLVIYFIILGITFIIITRSWTKNIFPLLKYGLVSYSHKGYKQ